MASPRLGSLGGQRRSSLTTDPTRYLFPADSEEVAADSAQRLMRDVYSNAREVSTRQGMYGFSSSSSYEVPPAALERGLRQLAPVGAAGWLHDGMPPAESGWAWPSSSRGGVPLADAGGEDPWGDILANSSGDVCLVPAAELERLRRIGEAQLEEIMELRRLLAGEAEDEEEMNAIEARIEEMEIQRVVAANEVYLRRQEADALAEEVERLRARRDGLIEEAADVTRRTMLLERWLDPYGTGADAYQDFSTASFAGVAPEADFLNALRSAINT